MRIINPDIADHFSQANLGDMMEALLELQKDFFAKIVLQNTSLL